VAFSPDGSFVTTGSADSSIKVLEVSKMKKDSGEDRPVIRTLYGSNDVSKKSFSPPLIPSTHPHTFFPPQAINDLAFHPNGITLASCSKDFHVRFYDLSKSSARHPFRFIKNAQEAVNVRSIAFHPSGDFLLAGTDQDTVRIYDMTTFACYVSPNVSEFHRGAINQIRYAPHGRFYVTAGKDGAVKIWDTVTSRVTRQIDKAHDGTEVSSATISRNSKYVLTTGRDSITRLWDVGSGRLVSSYEGAKTKTHRLQSCFTSSEDHVLCGDEASNNIIVWDTRTGVMVHTLSGHTNIVRTLASSPNGMGFMSGSEDSRARFWNVEQ